WRARCDGRIRGRSIFVDVQREGGVMGRVDGFFIGAGAKPGFMGRLVVVRPNGRSHHLDGLALPQEAKRSGKGDYQIFARGWAADIGAAIGKCGSANRGGSQHHGSCIFENITSFHCSSSELFWTDTPTTGIRSYSGSAKRRKCRPVIGV